MKILIELILIKIFSRNKNINNILNRHQAYRTDILLKTAMAFLTKTIMIARLEDHISRSYLTPLAKKIIYHNSWV